MLLKCNERLAPMYCQCTLYAGENKAILMLHVLCDVTYNFQQNRNYWKDLHCSTFLWLV